MQLNFQKMISQNDIQNKKNIADLSIKQKWTKRIVLGMIFNDINRK